MLLAEPVGERKSCLPCPSTEPSDALDPVSVGLETERRVSGIMNTPNTKTGISILSCGLNLPRRCKNNCALDCLFEN